MHLPHSQLCTLLYYLGEPKLDKTAKLFTICLTKMSQMCSGLEEEKEKSVLAFGVCLNTGLSLSLSVPGAPPRQVEVQTLNSTAIQVRWRSVVPEKQNGQVRGYQVHYACEQDGESRSLPRIRDIVLDDSQVRCLTRCQKTTPPTKPCHENGTSHRPF